MGRHTRLYTAQRQQASHPNNGSRGHGGRTRRTAGALEGGHPRRPGEKGASALSRHNSQPRPWAALREEVSPARAGGAPGLPPSTWPSLSLEGMGHWFPLWLGLCCASSASGNSHFLFNPAFNQIIIRAMHVYL